MTFNANLSDAISRVRMMIADTDTTDEMVADATITARLTTYGANEAATAASLCRDLAMSFARKGDVRNLSLSVGMGPAEFYLKRAAELDAQAMAEGGAGITIGGGTVDEFNQQRRDTTIIQPPFRFDGEDMPGAGIVLDEE